LTSQGAGPKSKIELSLDLELVLRIAVGTALGGVIGYERDIHGRPAGLRTHAVVALASATFMVVSTHMAYYQHYKAGDLVEVDGSRIAASVVSGIGFLAGGAILRNGITSRASRPLRDCGWCRRSGCAPVAGCTSRASPPP
jgi:uncharacterized membrane protein YhiD involved in acid resistance